MKYRVKIAGSLTAVLLLATAMSGAVAGEMGDAPSMASATGITGAPDLVI